MVLLIIIILAVVAYWVYSNVIVPSLYWKKRGIFHLSPWKVFAKVFFGGTSFFECFINLYRDYPDKRYFGSYQFLKPSLFARDLDLIKQITVKDFDHFPDRMNFVSAKADPILGSNLFNLEGEKWKDMRSTLSPAFTSSKMRMMYTLMQETAEDFVNFFFLNENEVMELDMKNVFSRYTSDVIANCAFGIKCDSLKEDKNEFYSMGQTVTNPTRQNIIRGTLAAFFPSVFEFFRIPLVAPAITNFFRKIVKETISLRESKNVIRPDMIHLLMEAKKGRLRHENETVPENDTGFAAVEESALGKTASKMEITEDVITAQALVFFLAGFDTTSTVLSFMAYELALYPEIQEKLQEEVDEVTKGKGTVSYEEILKMKYLDQVVSETLRKYPAGFILSRICVKDYEIKAVKDDEIDFVLEKGCLVTVPIAAIQRDPQYFPDPDRFDPDRFSDDNKRNIVPGSYMPFGSGPRNCIGSRFALLEAKVLVVSLMSRFDIVPVKRTQIPLQLAKTMNLTVKGGFWLGFKKRSQL